MGRAAGMGVWGDLKPVCMHRMRVVFIKSGFRMKAYIHAVSFCYRILTLLLLKQDILLLRAEMDIVSL